MDTRRSGKLIEERFTQPVNALSDIFDRLRPRDMEFSAVHPAKALSPIFSVSSEQVMPVIDVQLVKAEAGTLPCMVRLVKPEQLLNTSTPIFCIEEGITTFCKAEQLSKAWSPMVSTPSGSCIFLKAEHPVKANEPISLTPPQSIVVNA